MRFIADLANWQSVWADVHVLHTRPADGVWEMELRATRHEIAREKAATVLESVNPDLVHHHFPAGGLLVDEIAGRYPIVGTPHGWAYGNVEPLAGKPWVLPISGPRVRIRNGIAPERYQQRRHHDRREITVGVVARRGKEKYPDSFLARLEAGIPDGITLHCVGDGWRSAMRDQITARLERLPIVLHGDVSQEAMTRMYAHFDALLIPSDNANTPYAALEAMAAGVPIVARRVGGLPETVAEAGLLGDDDDALLAALEKLRDDPQLRRTLGAAGVRRAFRDYSIDRMFAQYSEAYEEASGGLVRAPDNHLECSIVMPVYNTPTAWLHAAIASVLIQPGAFELILVDDGSTDPVTVAAMGQHAPDPRVRILTLEHQGLGMAVNAGVRAARSDLIVRLDSDDAMLPYTLNRRVAYLRQHPDVALVSAQHNLIEPSGDASARLQELRRDGTLPLWEQDNPVAHSTVAVRRYAVLAVGGYSADERAQDYDLWCRLERAGYRLDVLPGETWVNYRLTHRDQPTLDRLYRKALDIRRRYRRAVPSPPHDSHPCGPQFPPVSRESVYGYQ